MHLCTLIQNQTLLGFAAVIQGCTVTMRFHTAPQHCTCQNAQAQQACGQMISGVLLITATRGALVRPDRFPTG